MVDNRQEEMVIIAFGLFCTEVLRKKENDLNEVVETALLCPVDGVVGLFSCCA